MSCPSNVGIRSQHQAPTVDLLVAEPSSLSSLELWIDSEKNPLNRRALDKCAKNHQEFRNEEEKVSVLLEDICQSIECQVHAISSVNRGWFTTKDDALKFLAEIVSEIKTIDAQLKEHCVKFRGYSHHYEAGLSMLQLGCATASNDALAAIASHEEAQREEECGRLKVLKTLQGDAGTAKKIGGLFSYIGKAWSIAGLDATMPHQYQKQASIGVAQKTLLAPMAKLDEEMKEANDKLEHLRRRIATVNCDYIHVMGLITSQFQRGEATSAFLKQEEVQRVIANLLEVADSARIIQTLKD